MNGDTDQETEPEARRLATAGAAMASTREATRCGRAQLACVLTNAGIGDWRHAQRSVRAVALTCRLCEDTGVLCAFARLVRLADARAGRLLHRSRAGSLNGYLLPLHRLAARHPDWQRPPERWNPVGKNVAGQYAHLARWLLGPAEAGRFLEALTSVSEAEQVRSWLALPMPLTRRMAHCFLAAPERYDAIGALRWGQVVAISGHPALAHLIGRGPLGAQLWPAADEVWWRSVLHWFVNHPVDADDVALIFDYLTARRCGDRALDQPPDPHFSMKGRGCAALLERMQERVRGLAARDASVRHEFRPCGVRPGRWEIGAGADRSVWTAAEILDSDALREEAWSMRHCVDRYGKLIRKGRCAVWSLQARRAGITRRAVTIDLDLPTREIVECRGRASRRPRPEELAVLRLWAAENGLKVRAGA